MLGASPRRTFTHVTLPLLAPSVLAAASIVFLFTFTSFGVALLLADPSHATLEVEIYRQAMQFGDLHTAAALAVRAAARGAGVLAPDGPRPTTAFGDATARRRCRHGPRPARSRAVLVGAVLTATTVFLGGPLLVLVWRSLHVGGEWSLRSYRALGSGASTSTLFVSPWAAVRNSVVFAVDRVGDRARRRRVRVVR